MEKVRQRNGELSSGIRNGEVCPPGSGALDPGARVTSPSPNPAYLVKLFKEMGRCL